MDTIVIIPLNWYDKAIAFAHTLAETKSELDQEKLMKLKSIIYPIILLISLSVCKDEPIMKKVKD